MELTRRLRPLLRKASSYYYFSQVQRLIRPFSSSPAASGRTWSFFSDDSESGCGSSVYRHALKFQRPSTIKWREQLQNSVSFIGTVDRPLREINVKDGGGFGVHTHLNVKTSPHSNDSFRILLKMWNKMAEISIKHLKPNDFIYVSGRLESYMKADENGKLRTNYEVNVKEINYVAQPGQGPTCQKSEQSGSGGETALEKYKNRLHLWQVFFTNPHEWWDYRKRKVNPKQPDFKHRDTGEALWLNPNDPPWIRRQLELHDSRLTGKGREEYLRSSSDLSPMVYDGQEEIREFQEKNRH